VVIDWQQQTIKPADADWSKSLRLLRQVLRAAPAATLKLLRVVLYCSLTMSREHYNRLVQACGLPDIEAAGIAGANSQQAEA